MNFKAVKFLPVLRQRSPECDCILQLCKIGFKTLYACAYNEKQTQPTTNPKIKLYAQVLALLHRVGPTLLQLF